MNDFQIKCFLATVRHMNFSRAADELYIAQSAISRHIGQLEEELEVRLFLRRGKTIQLTPEGKDYYYFFTDSVSKYTQLKLKHQFHKSGSKKLLNYSAFPVWYISDLLMENADFVRNNHQEMELSMKFCKTDHMIPDLQAGLIDVLFHIAAVFSNTPGIYTEKIVEIPNVILFSEKHPLAGKPDLAPIDFKNEVFLYVLDKTLTASSMNKILNGLYNSYGFFPRIQEVPDVDTLYFMLESAQGVALMDSWCRMMLNSKIRNIQTDFNESIVLAWSENCKNPLISTFVAETREFFKIHSEKQLLNKP